MGSYEMYYSLWNCRRSQPLCRPSDTYFFIHPNALGGVEEWQGLSSGFSLTFLDSQMFKNHLHGCNKKERLIAS